ncbi:MAG: 23S rRNA (adenine(2503)-C(2))-methyltransferase RlmN [Alphaproteobacteria bacterium]|nr:23S rRNA (adenine(2503)-C(2))-methyltransferase RlmN [Pseudomonadota bacterium]
MTQEAFKPAESPDAAPRRQLIGLSRDELGRELAALGEAPARASLRAKQLWHWLYHKGADDFDSMTTLAKELRVRLSKHCSIARPEIVREQRSKDGTRKWLLRFADGCEVEVVYIPEDDRGALCISSQVGCTLTCSFCHTGTQRLVRDLTAGEIIAQLLVARDRLGEWPRATEGRLITNIVVMGMGEPLLNFPNVAAALKLAMDKEGIGISRRRITLSTSGIVPMIERCGRELGVNLAVSLHAVNDELRDQLVPINKKYPIAELIEACRRYPGAHNARRITFEYVMLKGLNDAPDDARALARLLRGLPAKINLIPFNSWPGAPFECSARARIAAFADLLNAEGYTATVREPRGRDILAACGQLKSASERTRAHRRPPTATGAEAPP